LRRQGQFAAGDKIELPHFTPDFQHDNADRIASQRVGGGPQRGVGIGRANAHHAARIEPEFGPSAHRQRAQFDFRKILPHPDQRPARRHASGEPCDESGRRRALMTFGKHLVHRGERKPAPQRRIRTGMSECCLVKGVAIAMRFEALDIAAQRRKRAHACALHAHCSQELRPRISALAGSLLNSPLAHLFMICSNIKLTGPEESTGIGVQMIHKQNQVDKIHFITLDSTTDFDGWRKAARTLVLNDVKPSDVTWTVRGNAPQWPEPPADQQLQAPPQGSFQGNFQGSFKISAKFVELAQSAILNREPSRFAVLYRLVWRLRSHHDLLNAATDPDVAQITAMAKAVHRDQHRMQALLRFREIGREQNSHYLAWFEPEHHIVEATAPFFASRFADMPWSILTSDVCAHWDGHAVSITPGIGNAEAPTEDRLEEIWRRAYASIFNPARLKGKAISTERPKENWRNLPEASIIKQLIADTECWIGAGTANTGTEPQPPPKASMKQESAATPEPIETLREQAAACRACHLWNDATQTVFGEGPQQARVMLVGEQPGDKEDLAGKPFVGPAGQMLDRALQQAGIDRDRVYITNAVKHFKFVSRGKTRLHQKPNTPEIKACRPWYERELNSIKPDLVVAMGATAAQCVFGKIMPINKNRGRLIDLADGIKALVTVHPSYLLRLPDQDAKVREYQRFVDDLKVAADLLGKSARAA
jgi:uracil-DNA glycosylase